MNFLFDLGHPAHVHLFRNPRELLLAAGHQVLVLARDKEVTRKLLDEYGIEYLRGSCQRPGFLGTVREFLEWFRIANRVVKQHRIDLVASIGSPAGALAARWHGIPHLAFNDTETSTRQRAVYYPLTTKVFTPDCVTRDYGAKQVRYHGLHDLSYLRPEYFTPDAGVKSELGIKGGEKYAIVRLVAWDASHDWGKKNEQDEFFAKVIPLLEEQMKVFISAEKGLPEQLEKYRLKIAPHRFHDALAAAAIVVGDGASTATEAAVLGVPSLYIAPFAGSLGYLQLLAEYELLHSVKNLADGISQLKEMINSPNLKNRTRNREQFLQDTVDVAQYIADQCELYAGKK